MAPLIKLSFGDTAPEIVAASWMAYWLNDVPHVY